MSERGVFGVEKIGDDGTIFINKEMFEPRRIFKPGPFSKLQAYLWMGVHGPMVPRFGLIGRTWGWRRGRVYQFFRVMRACGLFAYDGALVRAIQIPDAVPIPSHEPQALRAFVLARDGYQCVYCGATECLLHCDHVIPRARGGPDTPENLVAACADCNLSKGNRTPQEWLG